MEPTPPRPSGLLISRDLIFTSKVTSTARALGIQVLVAGNSALVLSMIEEWKPRAVFVDLAAGELVAIPALVAYRHAAGEATPFIAFGSHVDTQALDAAKTAGCALVLPRSKFSSELPNLIQEYLGSTDPNDA